MPALARDELVQAEPDAETEEQAEGNGSRRRRYAAEDYEQHHPERYLRFAVALKFVPEVFHGHVPSYELKASLGHTIHGKTLHVPVFDGREDRSPI